MSKTTDLGARLSSPRLSLPQNSPVDILLQNENGPCPLIAAANALLLRGNLELPTHCQRNMVITLEEIIHLLVNYALAQNQTSHHQLDDLVQKLPSFAHGMDLNPKFTEGIDGYERTPQMSALDCWNLQLVHGWLVDPQDSETYHALRNITYNQAMDIIIQATEAVSEISRIETENTGTDMDEETRERYQQASQLATQAHLIQHFLDTNNHQLTVYGLQVLYEHVQEGELYVFFRNNHYCTLTKYQQQLYTLVTDYGYANAPDVVWEKMDVVDGDTEFVNGRFLVPGQRIVAPPGPSLEAVDLVAQSSQNDADYQLALQMSQEQDRPIVSEEALLQQATQASLETYHGSDEVLARQWESDSATDAASLRLAQQLQAEENARASAARRRPVPPPSSSPSRCVIS